MKDEGSQGTESRVTIWFDGGAGPTNPGNGYGSYEIEGPGIHHKVSRQQFGSPITNNQAEYMALLCALEWIATPAEFDVEIWTDSNIVANQVSRAWKPSKNPGLRPLLDEAHRLLNHFRSFSIHWRGREANVARFGH